MISREGMGVSVTRFIYSLYFCGISALFVRRVERSIVPIIIWLVTLIDRYILCDYYSDIYI